MDEYGSTWCEVCRDHFDRDHFDVDGKHLAGDEYGPQGLLLYERDRYRLVLEKIARILEEELRTPVHFP